MTKLNTLKNCKEDLSIGNDDVVDNAFDAGFIYAEMVLECSVSTEEKIDLNFNSSEQWVDLAGHSDLILCDFEDLSDFIIGAPEDVWDTESYAYVKGVMQAKMNEMLTL